MSSPDRYTYDEWLAEAVRRWDKRPDEWAFKCPNCGHVATCGDFRAKGADPQRAVSECIGRLDLSSHTGSTVPCDYAAFGFIPLGIIVTRDGEDIPIFPFADEGG